MPVQSTWDERALPVLEAIYRGEESGALCDMEDVAEATGLEPRTVARTLKSLAESGFISGIDVTAMGENLPIRFIDLELRERGRRAIGDWPEGAADAFLVALNRMIATEADPEKRSRLAGLLGAAGDVGKQVLAGAIVAAGSAVA